MKTDEMRREVVMGETGETLVLELTEDSAGHWLMIWVEEVSVAHQPIFLPVQAVLALASELRLFRDHIDKHALRTWE